MGDKMLGEVRLLQRINRNEMAVELDILRDGVINVGVSGGNSDKDVSNWEYRNLERFYKTFAGKPLLTAYIGNRVGDGHNSQTRYNPSTGETYESYMSANAERIVGMVSEEEADLTLVERDGYTWVRVKGRIWINYAPELAEKLERTGRMSVSVETSVTDFRVEDGVEIMEAWEGLGVTILGDGVAPAVPGANIRALAALRQEFETMKLRVASLRQEEEIKPLSNAKAQENTQKTTEKGVKNRMNKKVRRKELAAKFPEHNIIALSDDGMKVVLLSKSGTDAFGYQFLESDKDTVIPERLESLELRTCAELGGESFEVDLSKSLGFYETELERLSRENKELTERCANLEKTLEDDRARERARRIRVSKEAAERQLEEINAARPDDFRFDKIIIDGIVRRAEEGGYADDMDENGEWCGDKRAEAAVRDVCMMKQMEQDKAQAAERRAAAAKRYDFEPVFGDVAPKDGDISNLFAGIR